MADTCGHNDSGRLINNKCTICKVQTAVHGETDLEGRHSVITIISIDVNDSCGSDEDDKNIRSNSPSEARPQTPSNDAVSWTPLLVKIFSGGTLLCIGVVIIYYIIAFCTKGQETKDVPVDRRQQNDPKYVEDECNYYQSISEKETDYQQLKNNTSIILKPNNVQEKLIFVTEITQNHSEFTNGIFSAHIKINLGPEGFILKGKADNNLENDQDRLDDVKLHLFPFVGDTFTINFFVVEKELKIKITTNTFSGVLTLNENFMMREDLNIRLRTIESGAPFELCFLVL
ncbi:unnamed protein product [Meganyctiphanes norvegica]|uniref:Uncharacterized protein n=1 Tax=Meganyctiphanes norvegica TaxID=48144 RepID=A0AAV2R7Z5_MEGNR